MRNTIIYSMLLSVCPFSVFADIGSDTANDLNNRYNDYSQCTNGGPAYDCSGVMIHTFDSGAQYWYPTEVGLERGFVSFSWLRNDINIYREGDVNGSIYGDSDVSGIIFSTTEKSLINEKDPAIVYCSYGFNGNTNSRSNKGCSMNAPNETIPNPDPEDYSSCYPSGIINAEQLVDKYFINREGYYHAGEIDQCSFSGKKNQFEEAMKVGPLVQGLHPLSSLRNNEIVIKEWSEVNLDKIPLNAFYYTTNYKPGESSALYKIKSMQEEYYNLTGNFIPIIEVDMSVIRNSTSTEHPEPFIYKLEDQSTILSGVN